MKVGNLGGLILAPDHFHEPPFVLSRHLDIG